MTQRTKDLLTRAAKWSPVLLPLLGALSWGATRYDATNVKVSRYERDRLTDSLVRVNQAQADGTWRAKMERRSLVTLCRLAPNDSECAP